MIEKDQGIYDAMNKAILLASGDVIGFLHADDMFANSSVLKDICEVFENNETIHAVYGDLNYVKNDNVNNIVRSWKSCSFNESLLKKGWMPPHPTLYLKKDWIKKVKGFSSNYKISSDYDFILKLFNYSNFSSYYIPKVLVKMRVGGVSNKSFKNILKKSSEDLRILRNNGFSIMGSIITLCLKNISKLKQYFY